MPWMSNFHNVNISQPLQSYIRREIICFVILWTTLAFDSHTFSIFSSYLQTAHANKMPGKLINILRNLMTWHGMIKQLLQKPVKGWFPYDRKRSQTIADDRGSQTIAKFRFQITFLRSLTLPWLKIPLDFDQSRLRQINNSNDQLQNTRSRS